MTKRSDYRLEKIWKRLIYPNISIDNNFLISSDGELMNENTGRILKPEILRTGYYSVRVWIGNKNKKHIIIHKAVAYTFLDNPNEYTVINHKDGNKLNNNVDNLEWCTYGYNLQHAYDTGAFDKSKISGENNHNSKLTWESVNEIRDKYSKSGGKYTHQSLADEFGVSKQIITGIINNVIWKDPYYKTPVKDSIALKHKKGRNNTSGHVGVVKVNSKNLYRAALIHNGVRYSLGYYKIFEDACKAYEDKLKELTEQQFETQASR